jgi:hypothetical protein
MHGIQNVQLNEMSFAAQYRTILRQPTGIKTNITLPYDCILLFPPVPYPIQFVSLSLDNQSSLSPSLLLSLLPFIDVGNEGHENHGERCPLYLLRWRMCSTNA